MNIEIADIEATENALNIAIAALDDLRCDIKYEKCYRFVPSTLIDKHGKEGALACIESAANYLAELKSQILSDT